MQLIEITESGTTGDAIAAHPMLEAMRLPTLALYQNNGFQPPWISYVAVKDEQPLGTCAFKSPPRENRVEIAYFTFPEFEGTGIGTWMAQSLVAIAQKESPEVIVFAQTLPRESASTSILKKLQFIHTNTLNHSADGIVWEWEYRGGESG